MGWFRNLASVLTFGIVDDTHTVEERKRRLNTPVVFEPPLTEERFAELAVLAGKQIKRLWIETDRQFVIGTVKTSSGINEWSFKFDYNDFGRITGTCWIVYQENDDSKIPDRFHSIFKSLIKSELNGERVETGNGSCVVVDCPNCGNIISNQRNFNSNADYCECSKCGTMVFNPNIYSGEKYPGIYWFCDDCNELLNKQRGFNDSCGEWKCQKCGHINQIDSEHFEHNMTLGVYDVRITIICDDDSGADVKTIRETKTRSVSWHEAEEAIDKVFKEFDKIYYGSKMMLNNAVHGQKVVIDDIAVELKPDSGDFPCLIFTPYQGFLYQTDKNNSKVIRSENFEYLSAQYVKRLFKEFYDSGEITLDSWWDK